MLEKGILKKSIFNDLSLKASRLFFYITTKFLQSTRNYCEMNIPLKAQTQLLKNKA